VAVRVGVLAVRMAMAASTVPASTLPVRVFVRHRVGVLERQLDLDPPMDVSVRLYDSRSDGACAPDIAVYLIVRLRSGHAERRALSQHPAIIRDEREASNER
jgi:hypothetical protein